ncbi:MAG: cyclase family protein [Acidimicrobiia bacterium]|nr:cyclase family protein [Acidimicrobiia bacterium]
MAENLWDIAKMLTSKKHVDLTHTFEPGIPHADDMPNEKSRKLYDFDDDGFQAHEYLITGQWGTHCDPPIHFIENGRTIDQITTQEMIAPLVIFDVREKCIENPDYALSLDDIHEWELNNGNIPHGAFTALCTGWSSRWPDLNSYKNIDENGISHTPGWSPQALEFLCDERSIVGCGHETLDTDPGIVVARDKFPAEIMILNKDRYQIEAMTKLDQVPQTGAMVIATFPKPKNGSGFPARVFAILP